MSVFAAVRRRLRDRVKSAPPGSVWVMIQLIREDRWRHGGEWSRPGFHALVAHRLGAWLRGQPPLVRAFLGPLQSGLFLLARNVYGIELPAETVVGRRLLFAHQSGIVIHGNARIGDDCVIRQNVTIGALTPQRSDVAPTIGNRVEIGAGAAIIGRVTIGDGARIGPNTVVMTNVPAGSSVFVERPRMVKLAPRPAAQVPRDRADRGLAIPTELDRPARTIGGEPVRDAG